MLGIGFSPIFVRWSGVPGSTSAFYRMALAQIVFAPWYLARRSKLPPQNTAAMRAAVWAGVLFGADLAFFNSAIMRTSAANAVLLGGNAPIFVAIGAWLMFGERPTRRFWIGFALSFAGILAIVAHDVARHPSLGVGDALATAGAVCYAAYLVYVRRSRLSMDTLTFITLSGFVATVTLGIICLGLGVPLGGFDARTWGALVGLAVTSQLIGQLCVAYAMGTLSAPVTSVVLLGQAPIAAILSVPLLGESISLMQIAGGALVLAGIYIVNARDRERPRAG
jgi:drug/metabolite transporter (DMT)-like permease